jgi:serine/threonine-protein kinase
VQTRSERGYAFGVPSFDRPPTRSEPSRLSPGDVLVKKYRLVEPLGEGGMAVVWVAVNMALETRVAVKILRAGLVTDPRVVARFRQEAKATAAIAHKNIVQVYDYGITAWGAPFIVMELLHGETLAQRLKRQGPMDPIEATRVLLRAMKGISVAHAKGIVHRDLKPENIFLVREENGTERPRVLDFGVSFVTRAGTDDRLTKAGGLVGTPSYLPPEAIEGNNRGDARGDVWALGVILYEAIAGQLPFRARSLHRLLDEICSTTPPPLRELVPGLDPALEAIVNRAMCKDTSLRYPGVREFFDDLNAWLGHHELTLSAPQLSASQISGDPMLADDDGPTVVGRSLESLGQIPTAAAARRSSPSIPEDPRGPADNQAGFPRDRIGRLLLGGFGVLLGGVLVGAAGTARLRADAPPPLVPTPSAVSAAPSQAPVPAPSSTGSGPVSVGVHENEASLDIVGLPDRSLVRIDGKRVERLPAPIQRGSTVHVRVDAPGYQPWLQDIEIEGALRLRFGGAPLHGAPGAAGAIHPGAGAGAGGVGDYRNVPY